MTNKKTMVYIDGFNLYFGLKEKGWKQYYWLNLRQMSQKLLKPDQNLVAVKYFTSRITSPDDKKHRQNAYIRAVQMTPGIQCMFGRYETTQFECASCGYTVPIAEEKMSDVQLATHLVKDALTNKFDVALIVSGDRDLVPAIEVVKNETPTKRVVSVFPPLRTCDDLRKTSHAYIHVTEDILKKSVFPDIVTDAIGNKAFRPPEWK